ncbi:sugar transferase [Holdemania massiliensis]|uniref:sugar transferase n=1 Tax=Holdemania massiliensis TaxID=1468449 RepID=UPI003563EB6D
MSKRSVEFEIDNDLVVVKRTIYGKYIKRVLDVVLSVFALFILSPVLIIISILLLIFNGYPLLYKSPRVGLNCKTFLMYKFRSMNEKRDENGELLPGYMRITPIGRFIRACSIDELPELINIIKGDMSILGPRPLLVEWNELYSPRHKMRYSVLPGLACTRIDGIKSNTWTWREQFESDIYYVEHISFVTDVKMFFAVIKEVFKHSSSRSDDTRVDFDGTNLDETRTIEEIQADEKLK